PEGEGELEAGQALPHEEVEMIEGAGADADENVPEADGGIGDVLVAELVEPAMLLERQRLHGAPSQGPRRVFGDGRGAAWCASMLTVRPFTCGRIGVCLATPNPSIHSSPPSASGFPARVPSSP